MECRCRLATCHQGHNLLRRLRLRVTPCSRAGSLEGRPRRGRREAHGEREPLASSKNLASYVCQPPNRATTVAAAPTCGNLAPPSCGEGLTAISDEDTKVFGAAIASRHEDDEDEIRERSGWVHRLGPSRRSGGGDGRRVRAHGFTSTDAGSTRSRDKTEPFLEASTPRKKRLRRVEKKQAVA